MIEEPRTFKTGTAVSAAAPVVMFAPVSKFTPVVKGYRCTGDGAGALFNIYAGGAAANVLHTHASQPALVVNSYAGFTAGNTVMIVKANGARYWHVNITSVETTLGVKTITLAENVDVVMDPGDTVYRMDLVASMPCGSATVANNGGSNGIAFGRKSMPLAGAVEGGTSANIITGFEASYVL